MKSTKWNLEDLDFCICRQDSIAAREARDSSGRSMLRTAIEANRKDFVESLLTLGAPIEEGLEEVHQSVLTLAARYADGDMIRILCKSGANVRQTLEYGWTGPYMRDEIGRGLTALHVAADVGNLSGVKALVELGADVNATTDDDLHWTPLFKAVDFLDRAADIVALRGEIVDYLLDHGAIPSDNSLSEHVWERMSYFARKHGYSRLLKLMGK